MAIVSNFFKGFGFKSLTSLILLILVLILFLLPTTQFLLGGMFINIGYRFQDHINHDISNPIKNIKPDLVLEDFIKKNSISSTIREVFPRKEHHPQVAIVACMDARLDTNEITGDTRRLYYVIRSAGSTMDSVQQEMLELAVVNGVKVLVLTTHTDCSAEKVANDETQHLKFPHLVQEVHRRDEKVKEFLNRPNIKDKIKSGKLIVVQGKIDSRTGLIEIKN